MSGEANVYTEDWDFAKEGAAAAFLGRRAGAEVLGLAAYELQPGARRGELHLHYANEEMIVVLSGTPTLYTLEGSRELVSGEVVACRRGRVGAHRLENVSSDVARVLIFSTNLMPEIVEYPERGTIFAMTEQPGTPGVQDPESYGRLLRVSNAKTGGRCHRTRSRRAATPLAWPRAAGPLPFLVRRALRPPAGCATRRLRRRSCSRRKRSANDPINPLPGNRMAAIRARISSRPIFGCRLSKAV